MRNIAIIAHIDHGKTTLNGILPDSLEKGEIKRMFFDPDNKSFHLLTLSSTL
ncbi:MAG: GTP-binding protein [Chlamydiota bacterium]